MYLGDKNTNFVNKFSSKLRKVRRGRKKMTNYRQLKNQDIFSKFS